MSEDSFVAFAGFDEEFEPVPGAKLIAQGDDNFEGGFVVLEEGVEEAEGLIGLAVADVGGELEGGLGAVLDELLGLGAGDGDWLVGLGGIEAVEFEFFEFVL